MQFYYYNEEEASDIHNTVSKGRNSETYLLRSAGINPTVCEAQLKDKGDIYGQYTIGCLRTWNQKYSPNMQVSNLCHGICGELAEILVLQPNEDGYKENVLDELGDLFYYRQLLRWNFSDDLIPTKLAKKSLNFSDFLTAVSLISDVGKKVAFHEKFCANTTQERYVTGMFYVDSIVSSILTANKLTPGEVMNYNLEKLAKRHGTSFNANYTK